MKRRLLNLLMLVSLVLCVAVVALWVRSYIKSDFIGYKAGHGERRLYGMISSNGVVWVGWRQSSEDGAPEFYMRSGPARQWQLTDSPWWPFYFAHDDARVREAWSLHSILDRAADGRAGSRRAAAKIPCQASARMLPRLRLRSPRHAGEVPGMRTGT